MKYAYLSLLGHRKTDSRTRTQSDVQSVEQKTQQDAMMPAHTTFGPSAQALLMLFLAILLCLVHHFFYAFLNNRSVYGNIFAIYRSVFRTETSDQALANTLGTLIARIATICMSAAIGLSFVQVFWWYLRSESRTIRQVDTILNFKGNVLNCFAWRAIPDTSWLALIALCAVLTEVVSVITPGSLTVGQVLSTLPCQVDTVNISAADFADYLSPGQTDDWPVPNGRALSLVASTLASGMYTPPPSPCSSQSSSCQYNVSFVAPYVTCVDLMSPTAAAAVLPVEQDDIGVWYADTPTDDVTTLFVASRDVPINMTVSQALNSSTVASLPLVALNCSGWNATYYATVLRDNSTVVTIDNIELGSKFQTLPLTTSVQTFASLMQPIALWAAFVAQLSGNISLALYGESLLNTQSCVSWSALARSDSVFGWHWAGNLSQLIPELMQNISISLLSASLSDDYAPQLQESMCTSAVLGFIYDRTRLLATYAVGLGLTLACLAFGLKAQRRNGRDETLQFSRILAAYPIPESSPDATLTLGNVILAGGDGRLVILE